MRYLSVCSGIEAATAAWHSLGWTPVAFAEIDKFPSAVLAHHYPHVPNLGNFTKIEASDVGALDLLVGGTPCQSFSVAGKRLGLDDARGNLALEFCRLARRLRPRWVVWENVPGVHSSWSGAPDGGELSPGGRECGTEDSDFGAFLDALEECGYSACWRVLDAQFVRVDSHPRAVPQRRERVFVVGYLGDWRPPAAVLLEPEGMRRDTPPRREARQAVAAGITARAGNGSRQAGGNGNVVAGTLGRRSADHPSGVKSEADFLVAALAFGGNDTRGPIDVATARNGHAGPHGRLDFESETFIAFSCKDHGADAQDDHAPTLRAMGHSDSHANAGGQLAVAHALRAAGFDASEDGTGRGTPIIPIHADAARGNSSALTPSPDAEGRIRLRDPGLGIGNEGDPSFTLGATGVHVVAGCMPAAGATERKHGHGWGQQEWETGYVVPIDMRQASRGNKITNNRTSGSGGAPGHGVGEPGDPAFTVSERGQAIAFDTTQITSKECRSKPVDGGPCHSLSAHAHAPALAFHARQDPDSGPVTHPLDTDGYSIGVQHAWAVRRLTPTECELLQGFPAHYTAITYRGKPAADGPRYKALGNSMAVNVMAWIGARVAAFEAVKRALNLDDRSQAA